MKSTSRSNWRSELLLLVGVLVVSVVMLGCPPPPKPAPLPKKGPTAKEKVVKEVEEVVVEETVAEPAKEPAAKPAEEAPKEPAAKPAEEAPKEPAAKPAEAAPKEPAAKPAEETPKEPAAMPAEETPKEPAAKPAEEAPKEPAAKPAEEAPKEPAAKPAESSQQPPAAADGMIAISAFAPADDLGSQIPAYIKDLEKAVETEEAFKDSGDKIGKSANTLILVSLGLGLHDQDNKHKPNAPAVIKAAKELAAAKDLAAAQAALGAIKKAVAGEGGAVEGQLKWEKVASLPELMKQVPLVNTKLKRYTKGSRLQSKAADTQGMSAVIAVIAHGSIANAGDTEKPDAVEQWTKQCIQMRDAAAAVNQGIRAGDEAATTKAMEALAKSCDDCHVIFHKEAIGKTDVEE